MNYLVVGKNGSGKSYFCVKITKDFVDQNKVNLPANSVSYSKNYDILKDRDLEQLLKDFSLTLDQLVIDNIKVYQQYKDTDEFFADFALFQNIEDAIDFNDYFRLHIIYNDFIKFVKTKHDLKLETLKPVHKIYSDINGIKVETVEPSPDDWRTAPLGSKIFYDEFQDRPEYLFDGNKPSKNPMILELSKIRHYDIDLYLITPDADNLHKSLRRIIHVLYFIKRPHGNPQCCSIYTFDQFLSNPRAAADSTREPRKYSEYELLQYKKSIQRLYTSAANHSSMKFQIPWKWIRNAFLIIVGFSIIFMMLFKIPIFGFFADAIKGMFGGKSAVQDVMKPQFGQNSNNQNTASSSPVASEKSFDVNTECRKAVNIEKPECIAWFDNLSKNNGSVQEQNGIVTVSYNPNKPFQQSQIQDTIQYEVTSKPIFSGCMMKNGRYVAYTQQGTILNEVSQEDCRRLIQDSDRPFNYFASEKTYENTVSSNTNASTNTNLSNARTSQQMNYANNEVEPHLQQRHITAANAL